MSKTRSDSKLAPHEDFIFMRLVDDNESYQTVAEALHQSFGVSTSASALSQYYAKHAWRWRADRAAQQADAIKAALLKDGQNFDAAKAAAIAQREFELAAGNLSVDDVVKLRNVELKARELDNKTKALELRVQEYEDRMQAARKAAANAEKRGGLTPEALAEIKAALRM